MELTLQNPSSKCIYSSEESQHNNPLSCILEICSCWCLNKHVIIPPRFLQSSFGPILFQSRFDLKWHLDWIKSCSMLQSCQLTELLLVLYLDVCFVQ